MFVLASTDFGAGVGAALIVMILSILILGLIVVVAVRTIILLQNESSRIRRNGAWLGLCLAATIIVPCLASWYFYHKPRHDFEQLLSGVEGIEITSLIIKGQHGALVFDEPAIAQYLTAAFRSNIPDEYQLGFTYYISVSLSTGGSIDCWIYVPDEAAGPVVGDRVTLGYPVDWLVGDRILRCSIPLPEPLPAKLVRVLKELRSPHSARLN